MNLAARPSLRRWLAHVSRPRGRAMAVTIVSLMGWTLWNAAREVHHPWADLSSGRFTDHIAHMNAARLFPTVGMDLYRTPVAKLFRRATADEIARMPEDLQAGGSETGGVYIVPGWPIHKQLVMSWTQKTRMYPPGDMLLVAPIAAVYHYTSLSLKSASRLLIGWYIVLAHLALYFFFALLFESKHGGIEWLACFLAYSNILHFTLEGFYDAAAIVPLVIGAGYLARGRGSAAAFSYCVAAFVHFRAFFLAPWALYAGYLMLKQRFWRSFHGRYPYLFGLAVVLGGLSLLAFALDWSSLSEVGAFSPLYLSGRVHGRHMAWAFQLLLAVCALFFVGMRAWLDLAVLLWLGGMMTLLREFCTWHLVVPMAWMAAPAAPNRARAVRVAFLATVVALVFTDSFTPAWIRSLAP